MTKSKRPILSSAGGSRAWKKLKDQVVREEPVCWLRFPRCTGRSTTADHYWPVKYRPDLVSVRQNLRGACDYCNRARGATLPGDLPRKRLELAKAVGSRRQSKALAFFS